MTDDERIARLTELARQVWPGHADEIYASRDAVTSGRGHLLLAVDPEHPHCSDALEAALLVLVHGRETVLRSLARMGIAPREPPAWVEELAQRWEADSKEHESLVVLADAAEQLRERAKG